MYNLELFLFRIESIHFRRLVWFDTAEDRHWLVEDEKGFAGRYLLQSLLQYLLFIIQ